MNHEGNPVSLWFVQGLLLLFCSLDLLSFSNNQLNHLELITVGISFHIVIFLFESLCRPQLTDVGWIITTDDPEYPSTRSGHDSPFYLVETCVYRIFGPLEREFYTKRHAGDPQNDPMRNARILNNHHDS